jgi:hypothetical protein
MLQISYRCYTGTPGCCTCCNDYTRMFQEFVQNILFVSDICCKCVYLDVAYVANDYAASVCFECLVCLRCILQLYHLSVIKVDLDIGVVEVKPSVVQLLWLPWCHEDGGRRHDSGRDGMPHEDRSRWGAGWDAGEGATCVERSCESSVESPMFGVGN